MTGTSPANRVGGGAPSADELRARKRALREVKLAERRALPPNEAMQRGIAAQEELLALDAYRKARVVHSYVGVKANEVRTERILLETLRSGRRLVVPRIAGDDLEHREIRSLSELRAAAFGLLEPSASAPSVDPAEIDVVVVPGVAFDRSGGRLGLGKGFYDRFLAVTRGVKAGLLYSLQVVDEVPMGEADVRVDVLVTEHGVIVPSENGA